MYRKILSQAVTGLMVVCALGMTALAVRQQFFAAPAAAAVAGPPQAVPVDGWRELARTGQRIGAANAKVTVVEFSDFQCPFCARLQQSLHAILERDPGAFTLVYRHYPLAQHPYARDAALAAECAGAQGRFAAFHDALFANQDSIGVAGWRWFADRAGVRDAAALEQCVARGDARGRLEEDRRAGTKLHIDGTPAFIVNGRMYSGAPPQPELERILAEAAR